MNSKVKAVIICSVVLVLLIGALVALKLTEAEPADSSSASSEVTSKLLYEKKQEDVQSVLIKTGGDEYEVTLSGDKEWTVEEFKGVPLSSNMLAAITNAVCTVTAQEVIEENASDLAKYGLADPVADVTVTFKDSAKTVKELLIGNPTPTANAKTYFAIKGENTVYTVFTSAITSLKNPKEAVVQTTLLEEPDTYPIIQEVKIERPDLGYDVRLTYDESLEPSTSDSSAASTAASEYDTTHVMVAPIKASLDSEQASPLIRGLFGLTAKTVTAVFPTDELKEKAGLNTPTAVITTVLEDKTYVLRIGAKDSGTGYYYGMLDGVDVLYEFGEDALPWVTFKPSEITAYMIGGYYIYDIESLTLTTPTSKDVFELSGESTSELVVKRNGNDMADSARFRTFYQFILMTPSDNIWTQEPASATPDVKLAYVMKNGDRHTMEFYNAENRQTIIKVDGITSYKCRTTYVERLLSNLALLDGTDEIVLSW